MGALGSIMLELVNAGSKPADIVSTRAKSAYLGVTKPRIHTKLSESPSLGSDFAAFCSKYGRDLMPWQEWLGEQVLRIRPDNKWETPVHTALISRQNGKSEFMAWQILWRIFGLKQKLQVHTAHKLTTSAEIFYKILGIIQEHAELESQLTKKLEALTRYLRPSVNCNSWNPRASSFFVSWDSSSGCSWIIPRIL